MKNPRAALGVALVLALGLLTACGSSDGGAAAADGGEVTVSTNQAWAGFNPYQPDQGTSIGIALGNAIYPSAFNVQSDQTAKLNSDLLESAELTSESPQTVVYKIKDSAVWSDGTPITVKDFEYLWKHLNGSNDKLLVTNAIGYNQIASVESDGNDKTVKVTFSAPFGDWQSLFTPILPAHFMATLGDDVTAWNEGLVSKTAPSGGPFIVKENKPDEYVLLERNPKWYGEKAKLDSVTLRYFADDQAAVQALGSGENDFTLNLKATQAVIGQVKAISTVNSEVVATTNQQFINTQFGSPTVGELAVRQAIATAVDPEALAKSVYGEDVAGLLTNHHIYAPTSTNYADNKPEDGYGSGDAEAAAKILEADGWAKGDDGIFAKGGKKLNLDFLIRAEDGFAKQVAVILQDTLKKAGIGVVVKPVGAQDYFPTAGKGEFDIGFGNYPATAFPVSYYASLYPCKGGYNFAHYCNKDVDALYAKANAALDPKEQADLVQQIDKQLWADVANIPMFEVPQLIASNKSLDGFDEKLPKEWLLLDASNWSMSK